MTCLRSSGTSFGRWHIVSILFLLQIELPFGITQSKSLHFRCSNTLCWAFFNETFKLPVRATDALTGNRSHFKRKDTRLAYRPTSTSSWQIKIEIVSGYSSDERKLRFFSNSLHYAYCRPANLGDFCEKRLFGHCWKRESFLKMYQKLKRNAADNLPGGHVCFPLGFKNPARARERSSFSYPSHARS